MAQGGKKQQKNMSKEVKEKGNLEELKRVVPYKWRVQSASKSSAKAQCVAYIDARQVMALLDEVVGPENWMDDYRQIDGKLFAGIGIKVGDHWVWKWDTGTESDIEADKGVVSDSFKRAGVKWGIGRFLYDFPMQWVDTNAINTGNNRPYPVDASGKRIYDLTKHINAEIRRRQGQSQ